jgi:hypothetical protein
MHAEVIVLRLVHILGGILWVGSALFNAYFLLPALTAAGPASAGPVMAGLRNRKLLTVLPIVALLTILSGARLLWIAAGGSLSAYLATNVGRVFALSGAAATLGFLIGVVVSRSAALQTASLSAKMAAATDDATRASLGGQLEAARRRGAIAGTVVGVLLVLAAAGMATARYLG